MKIQLNYGGLFMLRTEEIVSELKKRNYNVENKQYTKEGIRYNLLIIKDEETQSAISINLGDYIYKHQNISLSEMLSMIEQMYNEHVKEEKSLNKTNILRNICIALRKPENDYAVKKETPFDGIQQYLCMYKEVNGEIIHTPIPYFTLENHGITEEEAWEHAIQNNLKSMKIIPASDILKKYNLNRDNETIDVYVLTNESMCYGAAAVLNTEALKNALKDSATTEWQVFFLSVHKALLMPQQPNKEASDAIKIVKRVNHVETHMRDLLSDNTFTLSL